MSSSFFQKLYALKNCNQSMVWVGMGTFASHLKGWGFDSHLSPCFGGFLHVLGFHPPVQRHAFVGCLAFLNRM